MLQQKPHPLANQLAASIGFCLLLGLATPSLSQPISQPPSGENQKASVTQFIGPVSITIDYSSPDVTGPQGQDRRGQIFGSLVPFGLTNLGFGPATAAPWRAGANENTTFTFSHDVLVQGKALAAGTYGFHVIVEEEGPWMLIFSNNSTAWGSFFYDASEDALRVEAAPEKSAFREWLNYDFVDRQPTEATVALQWEEMALPFTISVPNRNQIYLSQIRSELQNSPGFTWQAWNTAANFALTNQLVTEETLAWAKAAVAAPFVGQANFTTLLTQYRVEAALGKAEASSTLEQAVNHPTASPIQIHTVARQLQAQGDMESAIDLFKLNHQRHGDVWPVQVGLARAYAAEGAIKKALKYARLAREAAPDPANRQNLEQIVALLEQGKDFNATN